jgi:hypothetical protein
MLGFVQGIREKMGGMGCERNGHFMMVRPTKIEGTFYVRADRKKKERGSFEKVTYWNIPPLNKAKRRHLRKIIEPECIVG